MSFFLGCISAGSIPPYKSQEHQHNTGKRCHKLQKKTVSLHISANMDNDSIAPSSAAARMKLNWDKSLNVLGNPTSSFPYIPSHFMPAQGAAVKHNKPLRNLIQVDKLHLGSLQINEVPSTVCHAATPMFVPAQHQEQILFTPLILPNNSPLRNGKRTFFSRAMPSFNKMQKMPTKEMHPVHQTAVKAIIRWVWFRYFQLKVR